jgi:RHS repeat-associated protein
MALEEPAATGGRGTAGARDQSCHFPGKSATQNNGQITQEVDTFPYSQATTTSYQFDALRRLTSAAATGNAATPWTETFQYDGFGNLTAKVLNGTSTPIPVNAATNQLTNAYYDANGNMTSGAGATFTYDEANRVTTVTETSGGEAFYGYDASNKRIYQRGTAPGETFTFYGAKGENLGRYSIGSYASCTQIPYQLCFAPQVTNLWFAGRLVATTNGSSNLTPVYQDRLGTNRATGNYYPFGDGAAGTDNFQFATYTRDSYTGIDYADQRFYASTYGRFLTTDPEASSAKANDPGSWNRYAYVRGDPVNYQDKTGGYPCLVGAGEYAEVVDCEDITAYIGGGNSTAFAAYAMCLPTCMPQPAADELAWAKQFLPKLSESQFSTYLQAVALAKKDIENAGPKCENALGSQGVASLTSIIEGSQVQNAVYDGQASTYPQGSSSVSQFFTANQNRVGAEVFSFPDPSQNIEFLGPAFFDPSLANVPNGNYAQAQAFMVLHEAVHLVTGLGDSAFGGSKQLTNLLVQNCFPALGLPGALGGLTAP